MSSLHDELAVGLGACEWEVRFKQTPTAWCRGSAGRSADPRTVTLCRQYALESKQQIKWVVGQFEISPAKLRQPRYMGQMTEQELRAIMASDKDSLPDDALVRGWAKATGLTKKRVREIFGEVIGDPDPWGMPTGEHG